MAIQRFTDYQSWKSAVEARGLTIPSYPPTHEGPHEDDMYEPSFAVKVLTPDLKPTSYNYEHEVYGVCCFSQVSEDGKDAVFFGYLCDTVDECYKEGREWGDDPMGEWHGKNE